MGLGWIRELGIEKPVDKSVRRSKETQDGSITGGETLPTGDNVPVVAQCCTHQISCMRGDAS